MPMIFRGHIIVIVLFMVCCRGASDFKVQPVKPYLRNGVEERNCFALTENNVLFRIMCKHDNDTVSLVDNYMNGKKNGTSTRYSEHGRIVEQGEYLNDSKVGVWKGFYPDGVVKYYRYYALLDSSNIGALYYEKLFDSNGVWYAVRMPLEIWTQPDSPYYVGEEYGLAVELMYSEYDTVNMMGFIEDGSIRDTFMNPGSILYYPFIPKQAGIQKIRGHIIEINALNYPKEESFGAEKPFLFEYEAIERK